MRLLNRRAGMMFASAIALATLPALSAGPVAASAATSLTSGASTCATGSAGTTARLSPQAVASADGRREPTLRHEKGIDVASSAKSGPNFTATIRVHFHVISVGNTGNISQKIIDDQIKVLNNTYAGGEGGTNSGFKFTLASVTRTKNKTWYNAEPETAQETAMKKALHRGDKTTLNLYSTSGGGYLGWSYFLSDLGPNEQYLDGVVMDWRSMLGASTVYAGMYDRGETATHEVGHWLNLFHVFEGCAAPGDHVADTPPQSEPSSGCPTGKDSCPDKPGLDSIHNYMDYSYDECYFKFTPGQIKRMQDFWTALRA